MSFESISDKQWKQLIQYQLNGTTYGEQTPLALWHQVNVQPFYSTEQGLLPLCFDVEKKNITTFSFGWDYIMHLSRYGKFSHDQEKDLKLWQEQYAQSGQIWIIASIFSLAGASAIQEIAYTFAVLMEYLEKVKNPPKEVIIGVDFSPHLHFEIAKIKAFRLLWKSITELKNTKLTLVAKPSKRYCTNELLKKWAIEAMLLSDADLLLTSEPLSGNTFAANGLFFTDIAQQMARRALQILKETQKGGGYLAMLRKHIIQRKIREKRQAYAQAFGSKEQLLSAICEGKTLIEPLLSYHI